MLQKNSSGKLDRRDSFIERMADHVLSEGLAGATLRPLAAAAGTSDRMLLYYFSDKDELLTATLDRINARMMQELDKAIPAKPQWTFNALLHESWRVLASEQLKPFMPLWLDLAAGSARGLQPHRSITGRIADGVLAWVTARLMLEEDGQPSPLAPKFVTIIEGLYLISAFGRDQIADIALQQVTAADQVLPDNPSEV